VPKVAIGGKAVNKDELTSIFADLGANDPESWAESEIKEGNPQLARFLFLKGCWDHIVTDGDTHWIDAEVANTPEHSSGPFAGTAHAIRRLLASGANRDDITEVVRGKQAELLHQVCYQLSDPESVVGNKYVTWALVELDETDEPEREICCLHESVLETDPTGREMKPVDR
jgi:hypothetical protein